MVGKGSGYASATTFGELSAPGSVCSGAPPSLDAVNKVISPKRRAARLRRLRRHGLSLRSGEVDAIVVSLPAAFVLAATKIKDGTIVGQFQAPGGEDWGVVLAKGSALTRA